MVNVTHGLFVYSLFLTVDNLVLPSSKQLIILISTYVNNFET